MRGDVLGVQRPALIDAAMGSTTSLLAVGENFLEARALVLVNMAPYTEPAGVARLQSFMRQKPDGFDSLEDLASAIRSYRPHCPKSLFSSNLTSTLRQGNDGKMRWHWDPYFLAWSRDMTRRHQRLSSSARKLQLPTLLMRGESSDVVSEAGVQELRKLCPHADYIAMRETGHMIPGERNDVFGEAALRYLLDHVSARGAAPRRRLYERS